MEETKKTSQSKVYDCFSIMPKDLNGKDTLYGGILLDKADSLCGTVASRHRRGRVDTVSVETFQYVHPFKDKDIIFAESFVSGVGNTSMEIFIKFIGENRDSGEKFLGAYGFLTFVAGNMENNEKLPKIIGETQEEIFIIENFQKRKEIYKLSRNLQKDIQSNLI